MRKYLLLVLGSMLFFALSAPAQNNCVAVRGIAQIHLVDFGNPDWEGGRPGDAWVGPVQLALGENEVLIGKVSEYDGEPGPSHHTGQGVDTGSYFFDFGANGSFIVRYSHAVWPTLPKFVAAYTGTFHAEGSVDITAGIGLATFWLGGSSGQRVSSAPDQGSGEPFSCNETLISSSVLTYPAASFAAGPVCEIKRYTDATIPN